MIIAPGLPPLQQTRHSRELGRRVEQLVRDYQREHPDVSEGDVRAALAQLMSTESSEAYRRQRVLRVMIAALVAVGFGVIAASGGGRFENNQMVFRIIGLVAAVGGLAFAAIRMARRG
jgi:hypothetical protein